jgi:hypothetical protein
MALMRTLWARGWNITQSKGDGHCLLYSVVSSWNSQLPDLSRVDVEHVKGNIFTETVQHPERYRQFLLPPTRENLFSSLRKYLVEKQYNHGFGDVVPSVIANAFHVNIRILNEGSRGECDECVISPQLCTDSTVVVHRHSDHYNAITFAAKSCTSTIKPEQQQAPLYQKTEQLCYTSEHLKAMRSSAAGLNRGARKALFRNHIWNPPNTPPTVGTIPVQKTNRQTGAVHMDRDAPTSQAGANRANLVNYGKETDDNLQQNNTKTSSAKCQSVRNKSSMLLNYILENNTNIAALTETEFDPPGDGSDAEAMKIDCCHENIQRHAAHAGTQAGIQRPIPVILSRNGTGPSGAWNTRSIAGGANKQNLRHISTTDSRPANTWVFVHLNARSANNKIVKISEYVNELEPDLFAITETWITPANEATIKGMCPGGYSFLSKPRTSRPRGGGIGLMYRTGLDVAADNRSFNRQFASFEYQMVIIKSNVLLRLIILYRPPQSKKNKSTEEQFIEEFETLLGDLSLLSGHLLITGDFNLHFDEPHKKNVGLFIDILDSMDMQQRVVGPTHIGGHTLDYIITRLGDSMVNQIVVLPRCISDHHAVKCTVHMTKPVPAPKVELRRKMRNIDYVKFVNDLNERLHALTSPCMDTCDAALQYNSALLNVIEKHAPLTKRVIRTCHIKPWYSDEIHSERQDRRRKERKWQKTGLEVHRLIYIEQQENVVRIIQEAKQKYYREQFESATSRDVFKCITNLQHIREKALPSCDDNLELANRFQVYFGNKISTIRHELDASEGVMESDEDRCVSAHTLNEFSTISLDALRKLVLAAPTKSCNLDPVPTCLVKDLRVLEAVLPAMMAVVNSSIASGCVPLNMKQAIIAPLLKKSGLDREVLKNYRPVSNLTFLSKVLEKVVAKQIVSHMAEHNMHDPLQSAYRLGHSTETALTTVKNDIDRHLDNGRGCLLVLLDLSAAFDTIDHSILLDRLEQITGITGLALQWIRSYLTERKQSVMINGIVNEPIDLKIGVPQGSVLGPLLFLVYILPLQRIILKHSVEHHGYADDRQLYSSFKMKDMQDYQRAVKEMEHCIEDVRAWMVANKLKLNDDKTEFMVITSSYYKSAFDSINPSICVGGVHISATPALRNLGSVMDSTMSLRGHIISIKKSMFFHIRSIGNIRRYLNQASCIKAVLAFVLSRLDYANVLLLGQSLSAIHGLQVAQNTAARLVTGTPRTSHITPVLKELHWLPVHQRIRHKAACLTYKALNCTEAPDYMQDMFVRYTVTRALRSGAATSRLVVPRTQNSFGDRAFSVAAPTLWNALPACLHACLTFQSFKRALKTYLFVEHYD